MPTSIGRQSETYASFVQMEPNNTTGYVDLGTAYSMIGDYDSAIACTMQAMQREPQAAPLYDNPGYYYFEKGNATMATQYFARCAELDSTNWDAKLGMALSYYVVGDLTHANIFLQKERNIEPSPKEGMTGVARLEFQGCPFSVKKKEILRKLFESIR